MNIYKENDSKKIVFNYKKIENIDYKEKRLNDTVIHLEKLLLEEREKVDSLIQEKEILSKIRE